MAETVLITGASGGIGAALATLFAKDRSRLILVARSGGKLEALAKELSQQFGINVLALPYDIGTPDGVEALARDIEKRGLEIDVLVNNAGFGANGAAIKLDRDEQLGIIDLNIRALTDLTLRFLPSMVARGRGGVMQIGSIAGLMPGPYMAVYYASKAYVDRFTQALVLENAGKGVTIINVMPGVTETGFAARARMGNMMEKTPYTQTPEEVAEEAYKAFRNGKSSIITGAPNRVLGAVSGFLPDGLKKRMVARIHGKGHRV